MRKPIMFLFSLAFLFVISCQNTTQQNEGDAPLKDTSQEKILYQQALDIHNEIMPKMNQLIGLQKKAKQQSDSINAMLASTTFPTGVAQKIAAEATALDSLSAKLAAAEQGMNDWMEGFDPDPKMPSTEERAAYFRNQKQKADSMKKQFMEALNEADSLFATSRKKG